MTFDIKKNEDGTASWMMTYPKRIECTTHFSEGEIPWYNNKTKHAMPLEMAANDAGSFAFQFGDVEDIYYAYEQGHYNDDNFIKEVTVVFKGERDERRAFLYEHDDPTPEWLKEHNIIFG